MQEDSAFYIFEASPPPSGASEQASQHVASAAPSSTSPRVEGAYGCYAFQSSSTYVEEDEQDPAGSAHGEEADGDEEDPVFNSSSAYLDTDEEPEVANEEKEADSDTYGSALPSSMGSSTIIYANTEEELTRDASPRATPRPAASVSPRGGLNPSDGLTHQQKKDLQWNEVFQQLYAEMRAQHRQGRPSLEAYKRLSHHAHDFLSAAETYGKIIISERYLPNDRKTIKPVDLGGAAGGTKFICRGILFKFSVDTKITGPTQTLYMYGGKKPSDEKAMKAGGHELKGLEGYFHSGVDELHCPLMVLIDYRGYRLTAMSTLPISRETLLYGSGDAGKTVKADNFQLNDAMEQAGKHLNLAPHYVGHQLITGPGDIEGHLGRDGRFYVIDYARTFPPEGPPPDLKEWNRRSIFFESLRPELVRRYPKALSSDAFSNWQAMEPRMKELNDEVARARNYLHQVVIPDFAEKLRDPQFTKNFFPSVHNPSFIFQTGGDESETIVSYAMHQRGINMRHLGRVRACLMAAQADSPADPELGPPVVPDLGPLSFLGPPGESPLSQVDKIKALLLAEMTARVLKSLARKKMRRLSRKLGLPSEEPHRLLLAQLITRTLYANKDKRFWKHKVRRPLLRKFGETALGPGERKGRFLQQAIRDAQLEPVLIRRVLTMLGVSISVSAWTAIINNPFVRLMPSDISFLGARGSTTSIRA